MDIPALWTREQAALVRYARRLTHSDAEAEDLAQGAFVKALENADQLAQMREEHARAWLMKTVRNAFIDQVRRSRRQVEWDDAAQPVYEEDFSGLHVAQLMDALPQNLREIVRLRHMQGHSSGEIGRLLNLPPATVRTRLRAAMIILRRQAEQEKNT